MLVIPDSHERFTWVSIDPGLTTCGFAIFESTKTDILSIDAFTVYSEKAKTPSTVFEDVHGYRYVKMYRLRSVLDQLLTTKNPSLICCEAPFYNPRTPSVFGSLTETVAFLRAAVIEFNPCIPFITYSPKEVKQTFKVASSIGKTDISNALAAMEGVSSKLIIPICKLDEHSVDAIAVGYTYFINREV